VFRRRLKWFLVLLGLVTGAVIARLVDVQVLAVHRYEELGAQQLVRPGRYLPTPRGTIRDRHGRPLLRDEPASNICVHYKVLTFTDRDAYLRDLAYRLRRIDPRFKGQEVDDVVLALRNDITTMWAQLAEIAGRPLSEYVAQAEVLRRRVERIRRAVAPRVDEDLLEETLFHPVVTGAGGDVVLRARMELEKYPWVRVVPSTRRLDVDADVFAHLLGRTGEVGPTDLAADVYGADALRRLRPGDHCGLSGLEKLAEPVLRGTRGRVVEDPDRHTVERIEPIRGADAYLTLDADLQHEVYTYLQEAVATCADPAGGAAVVLDVETREVLALVSYPVYHYASYSDDYAMLRQETLRQPLLFRAVSGAYPPGSTCKAITLVGGLSEHVITPNTPLECAGQLRPEITDGYRCWIYNQYPGLTHGIETAETAVRDSCNIYFYKVGGLLGPERLCEWFERFGFGRTQGTGLIEESDGIVPTAAWLAEPPRLRQPQPADAWNWAIGQGEVCATPLQVANVAASVAAGRWAPVRLVRAADGRWLNPTDAPPVVFDESAVRVLRAGMWRVVNEHGGTGTKARLTANNYVMCGKTGSAQSEAVVVSRTYWLEWPDGRQETVVATTRADALAAFPEPKPRIVRSAVNERYPEVLPDQRPPAHAWFMGFTQRADTPRGAKPRADHCYAIAVLIEYGGSGGQVAAPVAQRIADWLLTHDATSTAPTTGAD
jgi:penicillin-binding protein 2